jgi:hypothetical protein
MLQLRKCALLPVPGSFPTETEQADSIRVSKPSQNMMIEGKMKEVLTIEETNIWLTRKERTRALPSNLHNIHAVRRIATCTSVQARARRHTCLASLLSSDSYVLQLFYFTNSSRLPLRLRVER